MGNTCGTGRVFLTPVCLPCWMGVSVGQQLSQQNKHGQRWQLVKCADVLETQEKLRTFKQTRSTNEIMSENEIQTDPG